MLDHCNACDTPFYVNLKSSLKGKQAVASEQQHSGSQHAASEQQHSGSQHAASEQQHSGSRHAASEQQARSGSTAAEGAAALCAVGSLLRVSSPPVSSSPGKAKGKEAPSEQSPLVSPMVCDLGAPVGGHYAGSSLQPCLEGNDVTSELPDQVSL